MSTTTDYGRRDFFTKLVLASAACYMPLSLVSCANKDTVFTGTGKAPFKVWEEMLQAVMASPDYLPGRMQMLIESKDAEAMYHFVKNEIMLIPSATHSLSNMGAQIKWGVEGALRCGMATPREKAELLSTMYSQAGITSKVVYERTAIKVEEVPAFFCRPVVRAFEPKISRTQMKQWKKAMGVSSVGTPDNLVYDYSKDASTLSNEIITALSIDESKIRKFDFRWDNYRTPTVAFQIDGVTKYAHLFDPNVTFGSLRSPKNKVSKAGEVKENTEEIKISISCRKSITPKEETPLVSGTWKAKDIVGKQLLLQFMHGLTPQEQLVTNINQLRTFTPTLALQDFSSETKFLEEHSYLGDTFTLEGKKIVLEEKGASRLHTTGFIEKSNPTLQSQVATIRLSAKASNFPTVQLQIDARDASGNLVEGLSPKDFSITENGIPVKAIMEHNQRTPKVLVLSDTSMSMPSEYHKKGMENFNRQLEEGILQKFPAAKISFWGTPSSLFTWLLKASRTTYDLIIYATDGDNDDKYNEKNLAVYQAGPPALVLNVKNSTFKGRLDTFNKMAEITGGKVFDAKDQALILEEIVNYVEALEPSPYSFSFGSSEEGKLHIAQVSIDNGRVKEQTQYQFPKSTNTEVNAIIGVYMTLKIGKAKAVHRVLAGWDPVYRFTSSKNKTFAREAKQLFLGGSIISIEGAGPTRAMAFHDFLSAKLSHRAWGETFMDGKTTQAKELQQKGVKMFPSSLVSLMEPLQDLATSTSLTFPAGS